MSKKRHKRQNPQMDYQQSANTYGIIGVDNMNYIELDQSSIAALYQFGSITYNGETISLPSAETFADRIVTMKKGEKLATYIIVHTTDDGMNLIADCSSIRLSTLIRGL